MAQNVANNGAARNVANNGLRYGFRAIFQRIPRHYVANNGAARSVASNGVARKVAYNGRGPDVQNVYFWTDCIKLLILKARIIHEVSRLWKAYSDARARFGRVDLYKSVVSFAICVVSSRR